MEARGLVRKVIMDNNILFLSKVCFFGVVGFCFLWIYMDSASTFGIKKTLGILAIAVIISYFLMSAIIRFIE